MSVRCQSSIDWFVCVYITSSISWQSIHGRLEHFWRCTINESELNNELCNDNLYQLLSKNIKRKRQSQQDLLPNKSLYLYMKSDRTNNYNHHNLIFNLIIHQKREKHPNHLKLRFLNHYVNIRGYITICANTFQLLHEATLQFMNWWL